MEKKSRRFISITRGGGRGKKNSHNKEAYQNSEKKITSVELQHKVMDLRKARRNKPL